MSVYLMKWNLIVVLLLVVSMLAFVVAVEPSTGIGAGDVEQIGELQEKFSPLDESGKVNFSKYKPFGNRAAERIDAINLWLGENASWLKVVFGMVPSITLLFAINLYLWLLLFMILVLNGNILDFGVSDKKFDFGFFEGTWGNILGAVVFVILLATKIIANLAIVVLNLLGVIWNYVIPLGIVLVILAFILAIVIFVLLLIYAPGLLSWLYKIITAKKEKKDKDEEVHNRAVLKATVKGITGQE